MYYSQFECRKIESEKCWLISPKLSARKEKRQNLEVWFRDSTEVKVKVAQLGPTLCESMDSSPLNSAGQNNGVGSLSLLWDIFPTQGLNPDLPLCRRILYQLSQKGSPRILEWVSSVQFSRSVVSDSLRPHGLQHAGLPCPSPTPRACSYPSSWSCYPTISSSVVLFSSCLQSFPTLRSFPMSQFFASGGQSIGASASTSVLPMNIQDWFPLGFTGLISLQSKGLSRVFSNTTIQKHEFFSAQMSL